MIRQTKDDLLAAARREIPETTVADLKEALGRPDAPFLLDVRERDEFSAGHLNGAVHVPRGFLEMRCEGLVPRDRPVVIYCAAGVRSLFAAQTLKAMGFSDVSSLARGFNGWKAAGFPFIIPKVLDDRDRHRYMRHLMLPEVGEAGQLELLASRVLCIGAGGLGSPAAMYLAAAGVGTLGMVDSDVVDESNLQRQLLHTSDRVGMDKTESARQTLLAINPGIEVRSHQTRLTADNVMDLFEGYDVVLDGCDNFTTRYLVNDACVLQGKPNVHGSIFRFEGQVTTFVPGDGPCYRCLYPEPPPPDMAPSCAEAGVLGVLPGVIGVLQAIEVIKLVLDLGRPLNGRLVHYDALGTRFRELKLRRDPQCPVCSEGAEFSGFEEYDGFCVLPAAS